MRCGPLHGGAPTRVLRMLDDVARSGDADGYVQQLLAHGERIMGFGHRVYRAEDPRARVLRRTARELGSPRVEVAEQTTAPRSPRYGRSRTNRPLETNVEFWAAVVLDIAEIPPPMYTAMFGCARVAGWSAHIVEQRRTGRLIRPSARYIGAVEAVAAAGADACDGGGRAGERLAEEAQRGGDLVLAEEDRLPVDFAGDGIDVLFAQETNVVGLDEGVGVGRIGVEFAVVELDGAAVLHAAMPGFEILVALDGFGDLGRGDGQRDDEEGHEEDGEENDVALLGGRDGEFGAVAIWGKIRHEGQLAAIGSICVLL